MAIVAGASERRSLNERQWLKGEAFLKEDYTVGEPGQDDRNFIEAALFWRRTGIPWRDLPSEFVPWSTAFNRFNRWSKRGKWQRLLLALRALDVQRRVAHHGADLLPPSYAGGATRPYDGRRLERGAAGVAAGRVAVKPASCNGRRDDDPAPPTPDGVG